MIEPIYTEEYAKKRNALRRIEIQSGNDPLINKIEYLKSEEGLKELKINASYLRINSYNEVLLFGIEKWLDNAIEELDEDIYKLKNPTEEELSIYTDYYFKENLNQLYESRKTFIDWKSNPNMQKELEKQIEENAIQVINELNLNADILIKELNTKHLSYSDFLKIVNNEFYNIFMDYSLNKTDIYNIPNTCYPNYLISTKDKISGLLLKDKLGTEEQPVAMEKFGNKPFTTMASINIDNLTGAEISTKITFFDWQVHNSILSLYIDGENQYITPLMIHRVMSANPKAKVTNTITKNIMDSIEKLSSARINIDASEEGKYYNFETLEFKGNLIYTKIVKGKHKGKVSDWIHIMEPPILYKYADSKNQITRTPLNYLNTPINKNMENIMIQAYLHKRILDMKGSKLSRNILYETVYKQLDLQQRTPQALRKKQSKIRDTIMEILKYWKEQDFIKGFQENIGPNNAKISLTIFLDK